MAHKMPLNVRQRVSRNRTLRYREDPAYRLACINAVRARRGSAPLASLDEVHATQRRPETRRRDASGRFAPDAA